MNRQVPHQLGPEYNPRTLDPLAKHVAPALDWDADHGGPGRGVLERLIAHLAPASARL